MDYIEKVKSVATALANEQDADILIYNGAIEKPFDEKVIDECCNAKRRKNVILILCTYGGDPSVGYRIARCLQQKYENFIIWIDGPCKSAGTLLAVGAHEIVISDHGELGPLDVQIRKKDELWETDSGLTILSAIKALEEKSFDLFESCFLNLKSRSGGRITLKTATDLASKLAIGTMTPIIAQIDPIHVGEVSRAMNIGLEYGKRLSKFSKNSNEDTLQQLTNAYPSHEFVIDREEAKTMFNKVREPAPQENKLIELLGYNVTRKPQQEPVFVYISEPFKEMQNENHNEGNDKKGSENSGSAIPESGQAITKKTSSQVARPRLRDALKQDDN
ncbi:MAG: SDH family Clp fold serine proteinase [bacterium]